MRPRGAVWDTAAVERVETGNDVAWAEWALAGLLCLVGAALVFAQPLFGGRSTLSFDPRHPLYPAPWARPVEGQRPPINPITSDIDFFVLPGLMRYRQMVGAGGAPWWDSAGLAGYPLAANLPFPYYLPSTHLVAGLDPVSALDVLTAFYTALAAFLAYRVVRLRGSSAAAGALAAVGFSLSTWMITRWHLPQIAWTTACFPGLLAGLERMRRGRVLGGALESAVWIALSFVSGFPQVGVVFVAAAFWVALTDRALRRPAPLGALVLALGLGLGLAQPQLNALGSVYAQSARAGVEARGLAARQGLRPGALWGALLPEFFGNPVDFATASPPAPTMESHLPRRRLLSDDIQDNVVENALYPGVLLLLLLALGLLPGGCGRARSLLLLALLRRCW